MINFVGFFFIYYSYQSKLVKFIGCLSKMINLYLKINKYTLIFIKLKNILDVYKKEQCELKIIRYVQKMEI